MKFRVGMKVRLVWKRPDSTSSSKVGDEGVIVAIETLPPYTKGRLGLWTTVPSECLVRINGDETFGLLSQYEPILPDTYQVTRWEDCTIWQPSSIREREEA